MNIWKRRKCDSNLIARIATCSTQTVSQNANVEAEVCKVPIKRTSGLTVIYQTIQPLPLIPPVQCRPSWVTAMHSTDLWRQNTIPLMHRDHLVGNRYFVPFLVFYTKPVMHMLGPRFIPESIFYIGSIPATLSCLVYPAREERAPFPNSGW